MEFRCISVGAKLEMKTEDYENLKKDIEKVMREKNYLEKKSLEKDQNFHNKCMSHLVLQRTKPSSSYVCPGSPHIQQQNRDIKTIFI
jgi:hypothetical protein